MLNHYLHMAFRNLLRNKDYTLINIFGLSIGITASIVIFLMISYDLSFDTFHQKYNSIYRVVHDTQITSGVSYNTVTPYAFADAFRNDFRDIPLFTQFHYEEELLLTSGNEKHLIADVLFADSLFLKVFDFHVLSGNPTVDLSTPGKVFLTKSLAARILKDGNKNSFKLGNNLPIEVAGIIEDPIPSSHINFSMIVSRPSFSSAFIGGLPLDEWSMTVRGFSYLVLPQNLTGLAVERRLKNLVQKYYKPDEALRETYQLQPLKGLHFDDQYTFNPGGPSNVRSQNLMVIAGLGFLIIFIACINFVNMATAMAIKKSREIGIRKTLGAMRRQVVEYFLGETFIITIFAVMISLGIVKLTLPGLSNFLEKTLALEILNSPTLPVFIIILILFVTLVSGFYPAIILSRFSPASALKTGDTSQTSSGKLRKVLVVFQFLIAQALIMGTLIIAGQMNYLRTKPLGFEKEAVITIGLPDKNTRSQAALRNRLTQNGNIVDVSYSGGAPTSYNNFNTHYYLTEKGKENLINGTSIKPVDRHYMNTYQLKLVAGRWFTESDENAMESADLKKPGQYVFVINESSMKQLGYNDPDEVLGKEITTGIMEIQGEIVGVVEDFHITSLHKAVKPVVLMNFPFLYYEAGIKIMPGNVPETLAFIEKHWMSIYPESTFDYEFLDEHLAKLYRGEDRTFMLFKIFAGISILIVALGLYALISFMANQKVKEVGIRKVLGASVSNIVLLFSKQFMLLIIIASAIASPIAWYFMNEWLAGFAYRINIHWSVLAFSILFTICTALLTVGYRTIKAAVANPVDILRAE